jgi:hypothetical protein
MGLLEKAIKKIMKLFEATAIVMHLLKYLPVAFKN